MSLGMGIVITYSSYIHKDENLVASGVGTVLAALMFSVLAGFAIMPAVFSAGIAPSSGPGLVYQTLPHVFTGMGASSPFLATCVAALFFFSVIVAAMTSSISLIEVGVAYLVEEKNFKRSTACLFQEFKKIGAEIKADFPALKYGKGYDNCFMINGYEPGQLQAAAKLHAPESGRLLEVFTTQPAVQIYTGNWLAGCPVAKCGRSYFDYEGVAIECQHCPDSPNKPEYPTTVLRPGETFEEAIIWQFSVV